MGTRPSSALRDRAERHRCGVRPRDRREHADLRAVPRRRRSPHVTLYERARATDSVFRRRDDRARPAGAVSGTRRETRTTSSSESSTVRRASLRRFGTTRSRISRYLGAALRAADEAGHHGARKHERAATRRRRPPDVVVASAYDSQYGHPNNETLRALRRVGSGVRTATHGDTVLDSQRDRCDRQHAGAAPTDPLSLRTRARGAGCDRLGYAASDLPPRSSPRTIHRAQPQLTGDARRDTSGDLITTGCAPMRRATTGTPQRRVRRVPERGRGAAGNGRLDGQR